MPSTTNFAALILYLIGMCFPEKIMAKVNTPLTTPPNKNPSEAATGTEDCTKLFLKFGVPIQQLWSMRGKDLRGEDTDGAALLEDFTAGHCQSTEMRADLTSLIAKILNNHSGKIGVILPLASNNHLLHFIHGLEENIRSKNLDPKKILVVLDNQNKDDITSQAMAALYFEHKVSAIIGGYTAKDSVIIRQWGSKLLVPTFLLTEPPVGPPLANIYYARPTQQSLAKAAVNANIRFGHKRISILSPADQHSDSFIAAYEAAAKDAGLTVINRVAYDSKRYDLMEASAKKIFNLDSRVRQDELKELYKAAKDQAKANGEKFNPNMVALQPDIQQDAVLIPDNFKVVRHFAKIFAFLGVRNMPLFGQFEWRSEGLLTQWDSFLTGSYFVDFLGAYSALPVPIRLPTSQGSPYFVAPDKIEQADYSLVGWRTIEWPLRLAAKTSEARRKLSKLIPKIKDDRTEGNYDLENTIIWSPSVFTVNGNGSKKGFLTLIGQ